MTWPLVAPNDDGIRQAGKPDECFYCKRKVGQLHGDGCVVVTKRIEIAITATIEDVKYNGIWKLEVPFYWGEDRINYSYGESSWCAGSILLNREDLVWKDEDTWKRLEALEDDCLCDVLKFRFVRVVRNTPTRKTRTN